MTLNKKNLIKVWMHIRLDWGTNNYLSFISYIEFICPVSIIIFLKCIEEVGEGSIKGYMHALLRRQYS